MNVKHAAGLLVVVALAIPIAWRDGSIHRSHFTSDFGLEQCERLVPHGANLYFSLRPGTYHRYEGVDETGDFHEVECLVTNQTRTVEFATGTRLMSVRTRIVEEREWVQGQLAEVARKFFARCADTNNIFFLGEEVDVYEDGEYVGPGDSWVAGVDGARPGLMMPGTFLLGSRYYQSWSDVSRDRAENVDMHLEVETDEDLYDECVMVEETSELEDDEQTLKIYAPRVGLIVDEYMVLVAYRE